MIVRDRAPWPRVRRLGSAIVAVALALAAIGCGNLGGYSLPPTYPVTGKVILPDGKPLTSGRIMFVSTEAAATFGGPIGADGTFTLKSSASEGAPEGHYKVRIELDETTLPSARKRQGQRGAQLPFADKYTDEDASQLTATVTTNGARNNFEFKLTK